MQYMYQIHYHSKESGFILLFYDQYEQITKRYKRVGNNYEIMRQSACWLLNSS